MQIQLVTKILGLLLICFCTTNIPPILVSQIYADGASQPFLSWPACDHASTIGLALWLPTRKVRNVTCATERAFWSWCCSGPCWVAIIGTLPFLLLQQPNIGLTDAFFESMSGLTTTGATVLPALSELPLSVLYYRQQLQWLGGMGIIVLAVAIMPMLGVGGMQLYQSRNPGPDERQQANASDYRNGQGALVYLRLTYTVICAFCYWISRHERVRRNLPRIFDHRHRRFLAARCQHGAFSKQPAIEWVAVFFMLVAAMNFSLALHLMEIAVHSRAIYTTAKCGPCCLILLLGGAALYTQLINYQ